VSERRALIVARETMWLTRRHRGGVDREVAPRLEGLSDRQVENETKKAAARLDQGGYVDHLSRVEADRHVSIRPAPDCMVRLSALLPVKTGVATYAALSRAADAARAGGDARTRGQVMADTLLQRVTGLQTAADVPLEIAMLITDTTLFNLKNTTNTRTGTVGDSTSDVAVGGSGDITARDGRDGSREPAVLLAPGVPPVVVPAELARRAVAEASEQAGIFIRRLYTHPQTGQLVAMDSTSRYFSGNLRRFLIYRDQTCRTPGCDAPIRHLDHLTRAAEGGPTTAAAGQGLCESCNYAKDAPGWTQQATPPGGGHPPGTIITTTPTGHTYTSTPPDPPGSPPPDMRPPGAGPPGPGPD
jgi:hypothetical protein